MPIFPSAQPSSPGLLSPKGSFVRVLRDRASKPYNLFLWTEGNRYCLTLYDGKTWVGQARCSWQGDGVLVLDDIVIANQARPVPSLWQWLQQHLLRSEPSLVCYRQRSLGTALLDSVIEQGRKLGATMLCGEVFQPDVDNNPDLLTWYQRRGFEAFSPIDKVDVLADIRLDLRSQSARAAAQRFSSV